LGGWNLSTILSTRFDVSAVDRAGERNSIVDCTLGRRGVGCEHHALPLTVVHVGSDLILAAAG
jgi:hypothetical protein